MKVSFYLLQFSRYWLKTVNKNVIFHVLRAITLRRSHLTNLIPRNFWRPYSKGHFSKWKNLAKPYGFGDICEKLMSDPYVLFLVMAAMFFDESKIPTSILCRISQETFIPSLVLIGPVVSEKGYLKEITLKIAKKTLKKGNNSNMA